MCPPFGQFALANDGLLGVSKSHQSLVAQAFDTLRFDTDALEPIRQDLLLPAAAQGVVKLNKREALI